MALAESDRTAIRGNQGQQFNRVGRHADSLVDRTADGGSLRLYLFELYFLSKKFAAAGTCIRKGPRAPDIYS